MEAVLVARATRNGEVYRICHKRNGKTRRVYLSQRAHLTEYVNSIQLYGPDLNRDYQSYFEQDPFTKRQNEVIKVAEQSSTIQREYSIMKDMRLGSFLTDFFYSLIDKRYKNGKRTFLMMDFLKKFSREEEIRPCYGKICSGEPLYNTLDFKDLHINKFDRVNWLIEKKIINV